MSVTCAELTDVRRLLQRVVCLTVVSKDVKGELRLRRSDVQVCEDDGCKTLKTAHQLRLDVGGHRPCDEAAVLDGELVVRSFVTAFKDASGLQRGLHTGDFVWSGAGVQVRGEMSGMTNEGTHREPAFDPACQKCGDAGVLEGRLCGEIVRADDPALVGAAVTAAYRLRFDPSESATSSGVVGTIEGLLVTGCETKECTDLRTLPVGTGTNPRVEGGHTFTVFDHTGTPTPDTRVTTMGGGHTGLDVGFRTQVDLAAPATSVEVTLVTFAQAATATALDAGGAVVDTRTMAVGQATPETLPLSGAGITTVVVEARNDETLLLELCVSSSATAAADDEEEPDDEA